MLSVFGKLSQVRLRLDVCEWEKGKSLIKILLMNESITSYLIEHRGNRGKTIKFNCLLP